MKIFRISTAILGGICLFGVAGTDQMYAELGQMPPDNLWIVFVIGLVLLLPTIFRKRKAKK